jgi:hypothetical protein
MDSRGPRPRAPTRHGAARKEKVPHDPPDLCPLAEVYERLLDCSSSGKVDHFFLERVAHSQHQGMDGRILPQVEAVVAVER